MLEEDAEKDQGMQEEDAEKGRGMQEEDAEKGRQIEEGESTQKEEQVWEEKEQEEMSNPELVSQSVHVSEVSMNSNISFQSGENMDPEESREEDGMPVTNQRGNRRIGDNEENVRLNRVGRETEIPDENEASVSKTYEEKGKENGKSLVRGEKRPEPSRRSPQGKPGEAFQPFGDEEITDCRKLHLTDLARLNRRDAALRNNRFLQYGYYNFGHLLICRRADGRYILGVPGGYDQQERFMANMFGFPYFKESRYIQLPKGRGGYWYRLINTPDFH
ncbi:MAG: DUF6128 domain-containing protein [Eubacteriales bacterium]|nr:DUF6128 domain-containing protein [Eubacteriales bacterium]